MDDAMKFLSSVDSKAARKIIYNIDKCCYSNDPELFKKLSGEIWEFRTRFSNQHYRLLAFWDKRSKNNTLVICSSGFVERTGKVPKKEITRAQKLRKDYFY